MKKPLFLLALLAAIFSCRKPYVPKAITNPPNYLVVEGTIFSGADSTIFKLSRTVNISSDSTTNPVTGAQVSVETNNSTFSLSELRPGYYFSPAQNLDPSQQYRLRIILADQTTYLSDFVPLKTTPPIDSIGFIIQNTGLQLYVNAHDANNSTRYYRWAYEETWQFQAKYQSTTITNGIALMPRKANYQIFSCFAGDISSTILLGSSAKLSQDVIHAALVFIPSTSEKVGIKYSILLRQYALTPDAFTFWTSLKTNSEQLGSIFDAQPSQINGNIHNISNPNERVFGYVSACTVQTKRIFIPHSSLPGSWNVKYPYDCSLDSLWYDNPKTHENQVLELIPFGSNKVPVSYFGTSLGILGYFGTSHECADCTIRGSVYQPYFWQ